MKAISELIANKKIIKTESSHARNEDWEKAEEFGKYVKIKPEMVMHLFNKYGKAQVLGLRSWLRDVPNPRSFYGLVIWKLKQEAAQKVPLASHNDKNPKDAQDTS